MIRVRALEKRFPLQRRDAPLRAKLLGKLWGWTGALDDWSLLNEGLPVLKGIDLDVYAGETLAIVGPSGAGKSTLLHLIGCLDKPNAGTILFEDQDLARMPQASLDHWRNKRVGFVFQFYHLFPDLSALENVLVPAMVKLSLPAYLSQKSVLKDRARELLEQVGLADRAGHRPSQLSGGEQQRVAISRALLLQPDLLLCDEPTGNLDRKTGKEILDLLWRLKETSPQTFVIVTHDDRLAERADRVVSLEDGRVESISAPAQQV